MFSDFHSTDPILSLSQRAQVLVLETAHSESLTRLTLATAFLLELPKYLDECSSDAFAVIVKRATLALANGLAHPQAMFTCPPMISTSHVARALEVVQRRYAEVGLDTGRIANELELSPWHLSRLVKTNTGFTLKRHLRSVRLIHVSRLLTTTMLSVKQIAGCTGYPHSSALDHQFHEIFDMRPGEFRLRAMSCRWEGAGGPPLRVEIRNASFARSD